MTTQKNGAGRPTKFTPDRIHAIILDIAHCIPHKLAAESNGICEDTLYSWINKGMEDLKNDIDSDYAKFSVSIKRAETSRIRTHIGNIAERVDKWQADAWILERRWWKYYGQSAAVIEMQKRLERLENDKNKQSE
jgi:hypothetical protein